MRLSPIQKAKWLYFYKFATVKVELLIHA